ncbi:Antitoxin [Candidatus Desulfarcum epimagneticum]|uniref:Antitoxin n=1 Tax=uncultured Desulfobacteraceae bacterium TaxID=218296 RepID=A0A484HC47_9BACT|nr:Antitoxin [uncultured Desulfobacteraceae bacterium]
MAAIDMGNHPDYNTGMTHLNISEIKTHFSKCMERVSAGQTITVCKRNVPIARISSIDSIPLRKRPVGLGGKEYPGFKIPDSFFDPLPDDIGAAFNGENP